MDAHNRTRTIRARFSRGSEVTKTRLRNFSLQVCTNSKSGPVQFCSIERPEPTLAVGSGRGQAVERRNKRPQRGVYRLTLMEPVMSAFMLYVFGFFVLLGGLGYAAYLLHVPQTWIIVGALVLIGMGVMSAVARTKQRDPPQDAPKA